MNLLYATDGSPGALAAVELLARLRLTPGDRLRLLAVQPAEGNAEPNLAPVRAQLAGCQAQVDEEVRSGAPAEQILAAAAEFKASLIVVGATGVSGLKRLFSGGVAERVLHNAPVSVLVARPVRYGLKRVLAAVDNSPSAREVVEAVTHSAMPKHCDLRLVTVVPPREAVVAVAPMVWEALSGELDKAIKGPEQAAEEWLRELAASLPQEGTPISAEIGYGDPASTLVSLAERDEADLVVLGSHGEGGVDRLVLGSVPERVARDAACSVLVIR